MNQELAVSETTGQVAQWALAMEPLRHLSQQQLDDLIERIDAFIWNEIEIVTS